MRSVRSVRSVCSASPFSRKDEQQLGSQPECRSQGRVGRERVDQIVAAIRAIAQMGDARGDRRAIGAAEQKVRQFIENVRVRRPPSIRAIDSAHYSDSRAQPDRDSFALGNTR